MFVFYVWPFPLHTCVGLLWKNVAYFPFNSWLSFQRLCRLLSGYHFHFVDSNQASNNSVIPVSSWHVCLFWSRRRQNAMMYRPIELKYGLFQLSTFRGAGKVTRHQNSYINSTTKTSAGLSPRVAPCQNLRGGPPLRFWHGGGHSTISVLIIEKS